VNTDRAAARGMSILEVLVALVLLGTAALGLVAGMSLASQGNALARRRTEMLQFAQARLERLSTRTRTKVPTSTTTTPVDCSKMATGGAFDPNAAPGTGGWMLDVLDGSPPAGGGALGDDLMAGPLLVEGDRSGIDSAATVTKRATFASAWFDGSDGAGCGSTVVTQNPAVLCREVHVEPLDVTVGGTKTFLLRVWVRAVQGGGAWQSSYVLVREDIAQ
jgi:type II secretory pathway pseudopilin PulG